MNRNEWTIKAPVDRPDLDRIRLTAEEVARRIDAQLDAKMLVICREYRIPARPFLAGGTRRSLGRWKEYGL